MLKIPEGLTDPDAGRVLAYVVCGACGSKVIGVVQERWLTPTPRGEVLHARSVRGFFGKVGGNRGRAIGVRPLQDEATGEVRFICPRHGDVRADRAALLGDSPSRAPRVVESHPPQR